MVVRFLPLAAIHSTAACACSTVRKASTRTASRSPEISVADVGTHIHFSFPGGKSRLRPWRFVTRTSHFCEVLTGVVAISVLLLNGLRFASFRGAPLHADGHRASQPT